MVAVHAIDDAASVEAAVARARDAVAWWTGLGFDGRKAVLAQWRGVLTRRMGQLADVVHQETGKPHSEAQLEIGLAIDHLAWAGSHAEKVLGRRRVPSGLLQANQAASVEYLPLGVVGVIGPWNYPVYTPMGSISYALAAGNPVVYKPSELTPGVGVWLADSMSEVVPDHALLQVVIGYGETGTALCRSAIDKLAFTGSTATGKLVMAACAENAHPGRHRVRRQGRPARRRGRRHRRRGRRGCVGSVHQRRSDLHRRGADLRPSSGCTPSSSPSCPRGRVVVRAGPDAQIGPMTRADQVDVVRSHIDDALAKGGRAVVGGAGLDRWPLRPADGSGRRTRGLHGHHRGDLRADRHRHQGARHGRGRGAGERRQVRTRLGGLLRQARPGAGAQPAVGHDVGQLGDRVRRDPRAALRRRRRLGVRPDPRARRAQGVHVRQGGRAASG